MSSSARARAAAAVLAGSLCGAACRAVEEPSIAPGWEASAAEHPLGHDDCVRLALSAAPTAAAWRARLDEARAALREARTLPNPSLEGSWEDFGVPWGPTSAPLQQTYSLAESLADVVARPRRTAAARYELAATEADLRAERQSLASGVSGAYDDLVEARQRVDLERELLAIAERERAAAEAQVRSGLYARVTLERAEAELMQARGELAKAEAEARARELELAYALGFERPVALELSEPMSAPGPEAALDREAQLAAAARRRPELTAAEARYRAQLERAKLAAGPVRFLPRVSAGARDTGGEASGVATLDVELPVFDRGGAAFDRERAALLAGAADLRTTARAVASDVDRASERLASAQGYLRDHALAMEARRRSLREAVERLLPAGEASWEELIQARRDEVAASLERLAAERALAGAALDLRTALGELAGRP